MEHAGFSDLKDRAKIIKNKVTTAIQLSNHYSEAYRKNPIIRVRILLSCIEQVDRLLLTLTNVENTINAKYMREAINALSEVVEAHNKLADEAIKASLEPIPVYIQKFFDAANSKLEVCKSEFFEESLPSSPPLNSISRR